MSSCAHHIFQSLVDLACETVAVVTLWQMSLRPQSREKVRLTDQPAAMRRPTPRIMPMNTALMAVITNARAATCGKLP